MMAQNEESNGRGSLASNSRPKWTIMVYLAGDGNLSAHCISVLQELEAVAYKNEVCLLACFDSNTPAAKGSRYLEVSRRRLKVVNGFNWELHNDLVPPPERGHGILTPDFCAAPHQPTLSPPITRPSAAEGVKRFIRWAVEKHEASERYMLIFVGHGPVVASQTFLAKENPPSFVRLSDLSNVLSEHFGSEHGRKLDILACNNCVMNGIETAVEVKDLCEYMIGSQGLMLAVGWPYQEMIAAVVHNPAASTPTVARKMLKACARNLLDFALMDRSSEQALCDLTKFRDENNVLIAVQNLVNVLMEGLEFETDGRALKYPAICDAIKLARLEAQSYWGETFVDLYDFCERLVKKSHEIALVNSNFLTDLSSYGDCQPEEFRQTSLVKKLREIVTSCVEVLKEIQRMVPESYYIGPELQYSHGLSIYFPWTRPEAPYFFTPVGESNEYRLRTAFQTYREYKFNELSNWSDFLEAFFRATLRRVRRANRTFYPIGETADLNLGLIEERFEAQTEMLAPDLQKSSSDTGGSDTQCWSTIKNYPRRNYLSPADCPRKIDEARRVPLEEGTRTSPPVSYLGWNISGLVAEVITARNAPKRKQNRRAKKPLKSDVTQKEKVG